MKQVVFREKDWQILEDYMSQRNDVESAAYAIFRASVSENATKILVNHIMIPKESDYFKRSAAAVALSPEFTEKAFQLCEAKRAHLLDIHTHPWSGKVQFSSIDDHEALNTKVPYLRRYLPQTQIGFIVFGKSPLIARARFWENRANSLKEIDRIMVI